VWINRRPYIVRLNDPTVSTRKIMGKRLVRSMSAAAAGGVPGGSAARIREKRPPHGDHDGTDPVERCGTRRDNYEGERFVGYDAGKRCDGAAAGSRGAPLYRTMRFIISICLILVLASGLGLPADSAAQDGGITLDQAVKRIKSNRDVRVLSAQRVTRNGQLMYRIKVLTGNGRVRYIWVDPGG